MTESPWVKWFTSDFLTGVGAANMKADEIGVYTVVLSLIADRGAPIDNDRAWIAGQSGTSTRRCNQIIDRLMGLGKLQVRNGLIGNPRMLKEIKGRDKKSDQARTAAFARWHGDASPELPIAGLSPLYPEKKRRLSPTKTENISIKNDQFPQKSAISDDADACFPRASAREESRVQSIEDSPPTAIPVTAHEDFAVDVGADRFDLLSLTNRIAKAGGVAMINPRSHAREMDTVKSWIDLGYDIEGMVLPSIAEALANTEQETIGSLKFYSSRLAKRHVQAGGATAAQTATWTPERKREARISQIALYRRMGRNDEADDEERKLNEEEKTR